MTSLKTCHSITFYFIKNSISGNLVLAGNGFYQIVLELEPPKSYLVKCTSSEYQKMSFFHEIKRDGMTSLRGIHANQEVIVNTHQYVGEEQSQGERECAKWSTWGT